jgi:hypothetical protein
VLDESVPGRSGRSIRNGDLRRSPLTNPRLHALILNDAPSLAWLVILSVMLLPSLLPPVAPFERSVSPGAPRAESTRRERWLVIGGSLPGHSTKSGSLLCWRNFGSSRLGAGPGGDDPS